jgi:serine acetyltransferase
VHIGRHCVIGANSTVTRDIPDYCVAVGSPARVVKVYDFREKRWTSCARVPDRADGGRVDLCGSTPELNSVI